MWRDEPDAVFSLPGQVEARSRLAQHALVVFDEEALHIVLRLTLVGQGDVASLPVGVGVNLAEPADDLAVIIGEKGAETINLPTVSG